MRVKLDFTLWGFMQESPWVNYSTGDIPALQYIHYSTTKRLVYILSDDDLLNLRTAFDDFHDLGIA
jgi:hypothetical protein